MIDVSRKPSTKKKYLLSFIGIRKYHVHKVCCFMFKVLRGCALDRGGRRETKESVYKSQV